MYLLFVIVTLVSIINAHDLNDIISRFGSDKCIEDNFIDSEIFALALELSPSPDSKDYFTSKNSLSLLHQLAQLNKIDYFYYLENEEGPAHKKFFQITLTLGNEKYKGDGMSLKEAKRHAAEEALLNTNYIIPEQKEKGTDVELTPTVELNNVAIKFGMKVTYLSEHELIAESLIYKQKNFSIPDGKSFRAHLNKLNHSIYHPYESKTLDVPKENQQGRQFRVGVVVGEMKFIGVGLTLQSAKHDAAHHALIALRKLSVKDIEQCINKGVVCNPENNIISALYEMAQETSINLDFEVIEESGPAHKKAFVTRCRYGDFTVEAYGTSKKNSKKNAAERMLERLKEEEPSNIDSLISAAQLSKKKKKRKNKLLKSKFEKFTFDAKSLVSSTWNYVFPDQEVDNGDSTDDNISNNDKRKLDKDFKKMLLEFSQEKSISTQVLDLGILLSKYYSLVFIGLEPKHVCIGEAESYDLSQQKASLEALHFFNKLGLMKLIPSYETFENIKNMDFGEMYIIGSDAVESEKRTKKEYID